MTAKHKRLIELFEALIQNGTIKGKQDFGALLGRSHTYIDQLLKGNKNGLPFHLTEDLILRLAQKINLNPEWFETGEGAMFQETSTVNEPNATYTTPTRERVYVVNENAFAGYTLHKSDPSYIRTLPTEELPLDLIGKGTIIKIMVYGDSMSPNFNSGEYVFCSRFEYRDFRDFQMNLRNGLVYLVITKESDPMIKRILHQPKQHFITCISDNEDQIRYEPFDLELSEVEQLWYVERKYGGQFPAPKFLQQPGYQALPARVKRLEADMGEVKQGIASILDKLS